MDLAREVAPRSTVALVLGASAWPRAPRLEAAPSFARSARDLAAYLVDEGGFALPRENLLDLFDIDAEAIELQDRIAAFLAGARERLEADGQKLHDIIVFYVGHGAYDEGPESAFYLAVRRTRAGNELASSLSAEQLARILRAGGRRARRYVILDCCFAGAAATVFTLQSGNAQAMVQKLRREFPAEGTALLCSSSRQDPSKAPRGATYTMFSGALLEVLRGGDRDHDGAFSIEALAEAMTERIRRTYEDAGTRPEVHCPDQRTGQVSKIPLFRNPGGAERAPEPPKTGPDMPDDIEERQRQQAEEQRTEEKRKGLEEERKREEDREQGEQASSDHVWRRRMMVALAVLTLQAPVRMVLFPAPMPPFVPGMAMSTYWLAAMQPRPLDLLSGLIGIAALIASVYYIAKGMLVLILGNWRLQERGVPIARMRFAGVIGDVTRTELIRLVGALIATVVLFLIVFGMS